MDRLDAGDARGALADFAAARARFADVATLVAIGNAHYALGDLGAACHAYEEALAWNRGSFRAHANLAEARRAAGDLDAARLHLDAARSLQPFHPKVVTLAERLRRDRLEAETRAPDE
ncbi:MAG: tetratricopeptide repeat protein [Myxococcales bacterium]|nr:tetratricopeptide repeat protein [Myxococcales bacterium]